MKIIGPPVERKVIFESKLSFWSIFTMYLTLILCTAAFIFLLFRVDQSPVFISIILLLILAAAFGKSMDKIIVAEDGFAIVCRRLIPRLSTGNHFLFPELPQIQPYFPLTQFHTFP